MPENDYTETEQELAEIFRKPNWVASRNNGIAFAPTKFRTSYRLDKAEMLGRSIGDLLYVLFIVPLRLLWTGVHFITLIVRNIDRLMVTSLSLWIALAVAFLIWLGLR